MRWKGREQSQNVEDRRGMAPKVAMGGGLVGVVLLVVAVLLGGDPQQLQNLLGEVQQQVQQQGNGQVVEKDDEVSEFISVVLRDTEKVWTKIFQQEGLGDYKEPRLVIYSGTDRSACGIAQAQMGPFYCPADETIYIDPSFFNELKTRHRAGGDFAAAYVIAHEVAHHVQKTLGFMNEVNRVRARGNKRESNRASVRLELQADYLAGVWGHHAQKNYRILEEGDIGEAITAANAIGDDTLQKQQIGYAIPERYTHGTSAQRVYWFREGLKSGNFRNCQTLFQIDYDQL